MIITQPEPIKDWNAFYSKRINSTYQDYFEDRYRPLLNTVLSFNNDTVIEMGCGIGSISKALMKSGINCSGFDLSEDMVKLANKNVGQEIFYQGDIFLEQLPADVTLVSHGVLEHFTDKQILSITNKYKGSIHYVPLDKYEIPSFGDERLLPYNYWLDLVKPREFVVFNNGFDLLFVV